MDRQVGANRPDQSRQAQVLHEHRIDASHGDLPYQLFDLRQLAGEYESVKRDVAFEAAAVQLAHDFRQIVRIEVLGPDAGVEARIEPEIDRVRAVLDRGANALAIAGGGE